MKNTLLKKISQPNEYYVKFAGICMFFVLMMIISNHVFAADLLAGTDGDIKDTIQGTAKKWLIWMDGGISLASFLYTKKPMVFFSVLGVCLFITALIKLAG